MATEESGGGKGVPSNSPSGERIMVFIDGSNMYHCARMVRERKTGEGRSFFDYPSLVKGLVNGRNMVSCTLYQASDEQNNAFFEAMRKSGINIVTGTLRKYGQMTVEKEVDTCLVCDMLEAIYKKRCDTIILVSGDADFVPALRKAKAEKVRCEVAAFSKSLSDELRKNAHHVVYLDVLVNIVLPGR